VLLYTGVANILEGGRMLGWVFLIMAILLEVAGTSFLKFSQGLTDLRFSILGLILYGTCICLLPFAFKTIELTVAYAIWAGLGTVLITAIGIVGLHESVTLVEFSGIALIIMGLVGLKIGYKPANEKEIPKIVSDLEE
jgi:small multidrug resistance pump